ncbi:nitrous oxide reductase accessory protein NosL [Natrarchaeobaculum aegyptiacum]|uniref:Lipoprotein n=1 Tax=Natrarchaeobaculum aegyptiacum TaxID=745377 RepID=A0A2Z2HXM5_9EURY|nr:nitrous oxide reductase accessory protein NosL [Natrarchaeobaculum aegyptiacum]ARS91892.1 hypothetical protein B1756_16085 [Natrarchaeobaculum aegyptiacum]
MTGRDVDRRTRRQALAATGTALAMGIAGCADDGDGTTDGAVDAAGANAEPDGSSPFLFDHPVDEPETFDSSHACGVCTMGVLNYEDRMAQLAHEDGSGMAFCSPGCLFAYVAYPGHFDGAAANVANVWVTTFDTGELIDANEASFVLERDERRSDAPMTIDPEVYEDEAAALEFVERYEDLDEDDVVGFDAVDEDVARIYRPNRLP